MHTGLLPTVTGKDDHCVLVKSHDLALAPVPLGVPFTDDVCERSVWSGAPVSDDASLLEREHAGLDIAALLPVEPSDHDSDMSGEESSDAESTSFSSSR